jgi:hypothetical protein
MFFNDLTDYSYYQWKPLTNIKNIGWLDAKHPFPVGEVSKNFLKKFRESIIGFNDFNMHVNPIRGIHPCNLCGEDSIKLERENKHIYLGTSEIWVPSKQYYFASPSMILHYIEEHSYLPPKEFIDSVLAINTSLSFNAQLIYDGILKK